MAMVAAAVANGGKLMRPHIGDRFVDPDGRTGEAIEPEEQSTVMTPETAAEVTDMMEKVVEEGTGTAAALAGIDVAGKTGTAEVDRPGGPNQLWFIAFAPARRPARRGRRDGRARRAASAARSRRRSPRPSWRSC